MGYFERKDLFPRNCTTDWAAQKLGCSRSRVRQFMKDGRIRFKQQTDRHVVLNADDVLKLDAAPRKTGRPRGGAVLD